ncbi:MAG: formate dehydrogenase accessory protein FdhE [Blastocatellia bacterium]
MATKHSWEQRIERATELGRSTAHARDILVFYAEVLKWQRDLYHQIAAASAREPLTGHFDRDLPIFLDQLDSLFALVRQCGSEALAAQADQLSATKETWFEMLAASWHGETDPEESFFARAGLQPYLERLAETNLRPADSRLAASSIANIECPDVAQPIRQCPFCGRKPQLALLTNETAGPGSLEGSAEAGRRFLVCGDCQTRWPFQRIACANCPETNPRKLAYFSADVIPHIRIECCESCRHYIKSIDLTRDNRCVPVVDELAALPLDLWAREQSYCKIRLNLAGM